MKKVFTLIAAALMAVGVNAQKAWNFSDWEAGDISTVTTKDGLTVTPAQASNASGKTFTIDGSNKTVDGVKYTQRIKFNANGSSTHNLSFEVAGPSKIEIVFASSSDKDLSRTLDIYSKEYSEANLLTKITASASAVKETYEYTGKATTIYLGCTGAVNLYAIYVTPTNEGGDSQGGEDEIETAPSISGVKVPDAPTVTLDLSNQTDFIADENGWIVFSPKAEEVDKKDYWTNNATNGNNRTWNVPAGTKAPFIGGEDKTCFAIHTERVHSLRFTGAESFSVLGKSNSSSRPIFVSLYTYDGTKFTLVKTLSDKTANPVELFFENLNTTTNYVAYFYASDVQNSDLYEVAIKAPSTAPSITATDATIITKESGVPSNVDIDIVGSYLTGSTLTAEISPAVEGLSVKLDKDAITEGSIEAKATITYVATENVNGTTTLILSDGKTSKNVTITYAAKVKATELKAISEATTWDFSKGISGGVQFTTDEDKAKENVYADIEGLTFTSAFDAEALAFKGEYPLREGKTYAQNGTLHFKTTVPGNITVKFSDTGTSADKNAVRRYLVVNNEQTEYWTSRENNSEEGAYQAQLNVETGNIPVAAGDVYIAGTSAITVSIITFTPVESTEVTFNNDKGYRTFASKYPTNWSNVVGIRAYAAKVSDNVVEFEEVKTSIPAGEGLLLVADDPTVKNYPIPTAATPEEIDNAFVGVLKETTVSDEEIFILYADPTHPLAFYKTSSFTLSANSAYISANGVSTALKVIGLPGSNNDGTTGLNSIKNVETENGKLYDLQGRQVSNPTKGLYISNGKKYIVK